jgi:hypothetical protein
MSWVLPVDVLPDAADGWMLGATLAAAAASAVSAGVVAYQAVQTRKSTEAAETNARAAVTAARISERMFEQSQRDRREAALPKVTIECPDFSDTEVYRLSPRSEVGWEFQPQGFRLVHSGPLADLDMFDELAVRVPLTFRNDGDESVVLTVSGLAFILDLSEVRPRSTLVIPARGSLTGFVMVSRAIAQWAHYEPYRSEYDPAGTAVLTCEAGAHRQASRNWQLIVTGTPFQRDPADDDYLIAIISADPLRCEVKFLGSDFADLLDAPATDPSESAA